jgi:hypothetical protein
MDYRVKTVEFLKTLQERIQKTIVTEEQYIANYIAAQEDFIRSIKSRLNKTDQKPDPKLDPKPDPKLDPKQDQKQDRKLDQPSSGVTIDDGWFIAGRKRRPPMLPKVKSRLLGSAIGQSPVASLVPDTQHELAPGVMLPSRSIRTPEECHTNLGIVCWDQASKRFWFSLNGYAISFSMGNVWWTPQDLKKPIKTTEFDPDKFCHPADIRNYYFPPELEYNIPHPSNDQRNFTAIATFCPTSADADHPSLRISDKTTLKEDIMNAQPADIRYAADYHAHGLGALIAMHHIRK